MRGSVMIAGIAFWLFSTAAGAAPGDGLTLSDQEIDARMNSVTQSLRSQQISAEYWEYGWGGFDAGTMLWSAAQASGESDHRNRNTDIVQAGESLIGLADVVLRPLPAFYADSVCKDPALSKQEILQCLSEREAMLEESAQRAQEPYELLPHLGNLGFNLLAGLLVWRLDDTSHALTTAVPGEIIGEIQLWTTPRQPMTDFAGYTMQFGPLLQPADNSHSPATGLMVTVRF